MIKKGNLVVLCCLFSWLFANPLSAVEQEKINPNKLISESILLHNKTAEDIIPLVQPFISSEGKITGKGYDIIIKTTAANLEEMKNLISNLDTPVYQLMISVSFDPQVMKQNSKPHITGKTTDDINIHVNKPGENADNSQLYTTKGKKVDDNLYTLQVIENQWATIRTGHSIPIVERHVNADGTVTQSVRYHQINSGFHVKPRLKADTVTMEISTFNEDESLSGGGKLAHYQTTSVVKAKLGNWLPLSASTGQAVITSNSTVYQTRRNSETSRHIFIKVDIIP